MISGKIWNIIYSAKKNDINSKYIKFVNSGNISPYMELNFEDLNYVYFDNSNLNIVEVNPYFRYNDIFSNMLDVNDYNHSELKEIIFNVYCHYLAEVELKKGMTKFDYYVKNILKELISGSFGENLKKLFIDYFKDEEKYLIAIFLCNTYLNGNSLTTYLEIIKSLYKSNIIYNYDDLKEDLIIYLNYKETLRNTKRIEFLNKLFLPIGINTVIYWEYHFLIIGKDDTSIIDECRLF